MAYLYASREDGQLGQCSGITPGADTVGGVHGVGGRELWWSYLVAQFRSKGSIALWAIGLCASAWQFVTGNLVAGLFIVAVLVFYSACVGAAVGVWLGGRRKGRGA